MIFIILILYYFFIDEKVIKNQDYLIPRTISAPNTDGLACARGFKINMRGSKKMIFQQWFIEDIVIHLPIYNFKVKKS